MKFRHIITGVLIVILIFMTACGPKKAQQGVVSPFYGGSEGVIAKFEEIGTLKTQTGFPEVWEDQGFPLGVILYNHGEHTLPAGTVQLSVKGISPQDFTGIGFVKTNDGEIEKRSENLPEGGEDNVYFGEAVYFKGVKGTHHDANVFIEYTYPYEQTIMVPQVCFKGDLKDETVCQVDDTKQAYISGGPIQIGAVVERPAGKGRITLEIPVRNVQGGKAKASDSEFDEFSNLYDELLMEYSSDWECTAKGKGDIVRIAKTGETVIRCKYGFNGPIPETDSYISSFELTLKYIYWDFINQVVRIRENPELTD